MDENPVIHRPIIREYEDGTFGVMCACGSWSDPYLWGSHQAAARAWLQHDADLWWPDEYTVDLERQV